MLSQCKISQKVAVVQIMDEPIAEVVIGVMNYEWL